MLQQIRKASPFDIEDIIEMLKEYRANMPYGFLQDADDKDYVISMLSSLMAGQGIVLIGLQDNKPAGMLIAGAMPSLWSPKHIMLTEFAFWVKPANRGGTIGYRLLHKYLAEGIKMKESGRVTNLFLSKMINSPDLNYERLGFRKLEEFWVM